MITPMPGSATSIDFAPCERERIDAPGAIQTHGSLWAFDPVDKRVTHIALRPGEEVDCGVGEDAAALDGALGCAGSLVEHVDAVARAMREGADIADLGTSVVALEDDHVVLVTGGATHVLVECRRNDTVVAHRMTDGNWAATLQRMGERGKGNVHRLTASLVLAIREEIEFDRVMIYRFQPDWSGQVIADAKSTDQVSYLGLHYPATDIPPQARELYLRNEIREISDTLGLAIQLTPDGHADSAAPVDLTWSILRAVSPYHLEYMHNLGVRSTLVSSIIVEGKLWGLVACHHRRPKVLPWPSRLRVLEATRRVAREIEGVVADERERMEHRVDRMLRKIDRETDDGRLGIRVALETLLTVTGADGAAIVYEDEARVYGVAPPADMLKDLAKHMLADGGPVSVTNRLGTIETFAGRDNGAAGAITVALPSEEFAAILLFRREHIQKVRWGGDPTRAAVRDFETGRLSPRRSFETWRQVVRGSSRAWEDDVLEVLERLVSSGRLSALTEKLEDEVRRLGGDLTHRDSLTSSVLNAALDGMTLVVATDPDTAIRVASTNAAFRQTFDLTADECEQFTFEELLGRLGAPERLARELTHAGTDFSAWSPAHGQRDIRLFRRTVLDSVSAGKRSTWSIFVFDDVTDLRREQQALSVARDEALRQARVKSEILANMSHELRTPLNAILGYGQVISEQMLGPAGDKRYVEYGSNIVVAGQHLLSLVNNLLDLSHVESGHRTLKIETFDLLELVREVADWVRSSGTTAKKKNVIEIVTSRSALAVMADRLALRQVLVNLFDNALKFSDNDSPVQVEVQLRDDGCPLVAVIDQGPGVPPDLVATMFQPFRQGASVWTRRHGGVGLGLSIVRSLMELHGGTATMTSRLGHGTRVEIMLPRSRSFEWQAQAS